MQQLPLVQKGMTGPAARRVQALVNAWREDHGQAPIAEDADFGDITKGAVEAVQASYGPAGPNGTGVDGEVGKGTWSALLGLI